MPMVRPASSDSTLVSFVGPGEILTSRQLQDRLVGAGKTPANARKIISRGHQNGQLWRSETFRMPGNERLFTRYQHQYFLSWQLYAVADVDTAFVPFNGQLFSAVGYSYAGALAEWRDGKAVGCPVLFDVHSGRCRLADAEACAHRIKRATY